MNNENTSKTNINCDVEINGNHLESIENTNFFENKLLHII